MRKLFTSVLFSILFVGTFFIGAAEGKRDGGLESKSAVGTWVARGGLRGGGLLVDGQLAKACDMPEELTGQSGAVSFLIQIKDCGNNGGPLLAFGNALLAKDPESDYLVFSIGGKSVRKPVYDWRRMGRWHHVIASFADGVPSLYVNGRAGESVEASGAGERRDGLFLGSGPGAVVFDEITVSAEAVPSDDADRLARVALTGKIVKANPIITAIKTATPPKIDGHLDDAAWKTAAGFSNFEKHFSSRFPEGNRNTRTWISWDDDYYYMAFKIPMTQPHGTEKGEHDKVRFGDKTVELFLMPNPSGELEYYQFAFDAVGTRYDARMLDRAYDPEWELATRADEEWWTAEIAIPYKSIDAFQPKTGARWRMNLVCAAGQWNMSGIFHEFGKFGSIEFVEAGASLAVGSMTMQDGKISLPVTLVGNADEKLTLKIACYPENGVQPKGALRETLSAGRPSVSPEFDLGGMKSGLMEIIAEDDKSKVVYQRYIPFNEEYFKELVFLKDLPDEIKNPQQKKAVAADMKAAERSAAEKADYRPTIDQIENAIIEQQKWLGNSIGKADTVPAPWTPLKVDGKTISCWAKRFDFDGSGLPEQISILEKEILKSPITLTADGGSGNDRAFFVKSQHECEAVLVGARDFDSVRVTNETRVEFDGFAKVELMLAPTRENAAIRDLTLTVPIKKEHAKYFHIWGGNAYGRLSREIGNFLTDKIVTGFEANVFIGDDERGFCWFAEAPENWSHPDDRDLITIDPRGDEVVVEIRIVKGTLKIDRPTRIVFGYMATPAKPRPDGWRAWEGKFSQDWWWYTVFSFPYPPKDEQSFREKVRNPNHMLMLSCYFAGQCYMQDGKPVTEQWLWGHLWHTRWNRVGPPIGKNSGPEGKIVSYSSQAMSSNWPDYYMYKLKELRDKYGVRSIYLDTCIRSVDNPRTGMTWTDRDGNTRGKIDIFAFREMSRRIYNFIREDPDAHVMMHHSNQVAIPILSFMDSHMNGEHFNTGPHQVKGRHYSDADVLPPGTFRASYTLKQWGIVPIFLPEHPVDTRAMIGYFWAHDTPLYSAWCDHNELRASVAEKQKFGMRDVEFLSYWENTPPAEAQPDGIFVSAYKKIGKPELLLVIANMQKADREIDVRLIAENIGMKTDGDSLEAVDAEFGQKIEIVDGRFWLPVREHDFRMLKIVGK